MSELKLVAGEEAASTELAPIGPDLSKVNPMDALNRRDIELIKRSLASMHKDCTELRNTIVAIHSRQSRMPSRTFFLTFAGLAFVLVAAVTVARPQLDASLHTTAMAAKLTGSDFSR